MATSFRKVQLFCQTHGQYIISQNTLRSLFEDTRAMLHDEAMYPDPSSFRPERFLDENGQLDHTIQNPAEVGFGFGRR